jgi:hypothetical protein
MTTKRTLLGVLVLGSLTAMTACARAPKTTDGTAVAQATVASTASSKPVPRAEATLAHMVVHKSASCSCCGLWVDQMRAAGFDVEVHNEDNINPVKERVGVPLGKGSCHTAEVDGYFIEGHVPAADIKRLLAEKPDARGLLVPGMPAGSPGMEMPDGTVQPYTVELVGRDGSTQAFAQH